ncbi:MAG: hypothetical protein IJ172_00705, partial [Ruminococcus sp.]|nr:hypothetical protein [Ruminococcus sp.]
ASKHFCFWWNSRRAFLRKTYALLIASLRAVRSPTTIDGGAKMPLQASIFASGGIVAGLSCGKPTRC